MDKQGYDFKDAFIVLKAVEKLCKDIYDSKSDVIIRQLENTSDGKHRCKYGLFNLKTNAEKTIKVYTEDEQTKVDELQAKIAMLQQEIDKLGTTQVIKEAYHSLVCNKNAIAEAEANELLQPLILAIGNASMIKAASSTKIQKK